MISTINLNRILSHRVLTHRILTATGIAILTSSISFNDVKAQSLPQRESFSIAQASRGIRGIERKIPLSEVPMTVITSVKTVTGADATEAGVEMRSDGSMVYEIYGQNQQGFQFVVDATPNGTIVEVDEEVDSSAIPENIMKAFRRWVPNGKIVSSWRSTRIGALFYEFVIDDDFWIEIPAEADRVIIHRFKRS